MRLLKKFLSIAERREKRTRLQAHCLAVRLEQKLSVPVSVVDISMTGMGFLVKEPFFKIGDAIELQFTSLGEEARVIRGTIISQANQKKPKKDSHAGNAVYRFSVQFDHSITEKYLKLLSTAFSEQITRSSREARQG